jgi:hypothetical protein
MISKGTPLHKHKGQSKSSYSERTDERRANLRASDREDCALYRSCLDALVRRPGSNDSCLGCPSCDKFQPMPREFVVRRGGYAEG